MPSVRVVSAPSGNTGKHFRCPYHAWTFRTDGSLLNIPLKDGYEGTALHECESAKGLAAVKNVHVYRGFIFVKLNDVGPDFEAYFGDYMDGTATARVKTTLQFKGKLARGSHRVSARGLVPLNAGPPIRNMDASIPCARKMRDSPRAARPGSAPRSRSSGT